jgi:hypothetical protein
MSPPRGRYELCQRFLKGCAKYTHQPSILHFLASFVVLHRSLKVMLYIKRGRVALMQKGRSDRMTWYQSVDD